MGEPDRPAQNGHDQVNGTPNMLAMIESLVTRLREQLEGANQRADRAEQRLDEERARADRAEEHATMLRAELADAQVAERKTVELVQYVTAEASEQRKRADDARTAGQIARDEAAGLRAELDARREWGLRRRLSWALSRRR
jgi:DNA uptake protein ComE-like DNA-binding protein